MVGQQMPFFQFTVLSSSDPHTLKTDRLFLHLNVAFLCGGNVDFTGEISFFR